MSNSTGFKSNKPQIKQTTNLKHTIKTNNSKQPKHQNTKTLKTKHQTHTNTKNKQQQSQQNKLIQKPNRIIINKVQAKQVTNQTNNHNQLVNN